jgi:hypothetical protein
MENNIGGLEGEETILKKKTIFRVVWVVYLRKKAILRRKREF